MNKTFFHVCTLILEPGSIIKPGNFGRVIQLYRQRDLNILPTRELCFEIVRLKQYPDKPSRLSCLFLSPTLEHAVRYVRNHCFSSLIYEVEIIDPNVRIFHGEMSLLAAGMPDESTPVIPHLMGLASVYWRGISEITEQYLVESAIKIISTLELKPG